MRRTYGPVAAVRSGFLAAMEHANNKPPEWQQGASGYGRRLASGFGRSAVQTSIEFAGGALISEDPRYIPCRCSGFLKRAGYAVSSILLAHGADGTRRPAFARLAGTYGGAALATTWYPDRYTVGGDAMRMANITLGAGAGLNIVREFWPEIKRVFRR